MIAKTITFKPEVAFSYSISKEIPHPILLPSKEIQDILTILLANAARYTSQGEVKVIVNQFSRQENHQLLIEVADTGCGISPPRLMNIFQGFAVKEDEQYHNVNIKLAIVKTLVDLIGGSIMAYSTLKKGTQFEIILPYKHTAELTLIEARSSSQPSLTPQLVRHKQVNLANKLALVVEDENNTRANHTKMLTLLAWKAHAAANGKQALQLIKKHPYAIILLDITLPDISGIQVLKQIKQLRGDIIPVLAITSHTSDTDRERFLATGFTEILAKPLQFEALKEILEKVSLLSP